MKENKTWIIIDVKTKKALYGFKRKTLTFSSEEIAIEVAEQFFETYNEFLVVQIPELNNI